MSGCFAIFEGGGAKGLAHIGALKALEGRKVNLLGVAGTSAGAIVAALVAAGWTADELYDPDRPVGSKGPFDKDFLEFFDGDIWSDLVGFKEDAERTFKHASPQQVWWRTPGFYWRNRRLIDILRERRGFFLTTEFANWLEDLLGKGVDEATGPGGKVCFRDLTRIPLKIVVTNLTDQTIKIFGSRADETPNEGVAEAVAASISIPFFFAPRLFKIGNQASVLVDGGLMSNFPAWVFDKEREDAEGSPHTLGFKLVEKGTGQGADTSTLLGLATRLFTTALAGDALLETRQVANLQTIPIRVRVSTFDFGIDSETKDDLYRDGLHHAREFFKKNIGPQNPDRISSVLGVIHSAMLKSLARGSDLHLRVNVALPNGKDRLRILYSYNMDEDADDRLEFGIGVGATGCCWQEHDFVYCDLVEAKSNYQSWGMTKYQQAMVRDDLISLLCVPIFDQDHLNLDREQTENPLIGVLNFDSNVDLSADFTSEPIQNAARECAAALWLALTWS